MAFREGLPNIGNLHHPFRAGDAPDHGFRISTSDTLLRSHSA
jgi:hypothetical protein